MHVAIPINIQYLARYCNTSVHNKVTHACNTNPQVKFEDVLGEPEGAHAMDCVWKNSYSCFNCCKNCCYKFMTLICGIPLAMMWGCEFAMITFQHVWCITPCMRAYMINCGCYQKFWGTCLQCAVQPCCEAVGYIFSNIKMSMS